MKVRNINKIKRVIAAWETLAPEASFGNMTLAQFKEKVGPFLTANEEKLVLKSEVANAKRNLKVLERKGLDATSLVVNGVRATEEFGEDSALFAAMGYICKSDRKSGLKRGGESQAAVPLKAAA